MSDIVEQEKLLDCPFCGATDEGFHLQASQSQDLAGNPKDWSVECDECAGYGPTAPTQAEAHAEWNTRSAQAKDTEIARLREALEKCRVQFRFYEQNHLAKYAPWDLELLRKGIVNVPAGRDAYEKALTNAEFAEMCEATLTEKTS